MQKINRNEVVVKMLPGVIDWLEHQKEPDGLINKLILDYRTIMERKRGVNVSGVADANN